MRVRTGLPISEEPWLLPATTEAFVTKTLS
jgi:hypothetical protein